MSKKSTPKSETVLAQKDGFQPRTFTMLQLESMGTDPGGDSYDGWKIIDPVKEPKEATAIKASAKTVKAPAAPKAATKTKDSDATSGKAESTGAGDNLDTERTGGEDSAQGSEGNGKAD